VSSINRQNSTISESFFTISDIGKIFSWDEVSEIHKIRNGIYQRKGKLISLLTDFGKINACYPDFHGDSKETIFYTGAGRRGDQKLDSFNRALFNAIESKHAVPLFNKLNVVTEGKYIFDDAQNRMIWKFNLQKSQNTEQ